MTTEVYINGNLVDLENDSKVTATYGNVSFGELNKRKGIKTNTFTAPFTQRNKLAFESCEVVSSNSVIPYRNNIFRVDIAGVTVFEGFCTIDESNDGYDIQSYAGASDFYSIITKTKLTEVDLSDYNHVWGETSIRNSWNAVDGYVYAFVAYGKESGTELSGGYPGTNVIAPDYLLPQIFFSTLVKGIAAYAGYTISGEVLNDDRFKNHVIIPNKFPLPILYGDTFNLSDLLPDVLQSKVWLDFANMYGQQFDIDDVEKEIRCTYIDDLLFNDEEDWTEKVDNSELQKTKYKLDNYGQLSYFRFKADADSDDPKACTQDYHYAIEIDDKTMDKEADIYKSDFYLIQDNLNSINLLPSAKTFFEKNNVLFYGVWDPAKTYFFLEYANSYVWRNGTYYILLQESINNDPVDSTAYWTPKPEKDLWDVKSSRPMYGTLKIDLYSPMIVAFPSPANVNRVIFSTGLDWATSIQKHYRVFRRIINRTKYVEKLIKLNYADVNQIRFDTAKKIDNELYILEEITQFKLNESDSTICKFIRL